MFRCTSCDQIDNFSLVLSANYAGPGVFTQNVNEHGEIIINIDGYEFIPDLPFMNTHAVCKYCGQINGFEYYFEKVEAEKEKQEPKESTTKEPKAKTKNTKKTSKNTDIEVNKRK